MHQLGLSIEVFVRGIEGVPLGPSRSDFWTNRLAMALTAALQGLTALELSGALPAEQSWP